MKKQLKSICRMNLIAFFLLLGMVCPAQASCETEEVTDAKDAAQAVQENWEDDYFEEMTITEDSNKIDIDGEDETFTKTFSVGDSTMKEAVSSEENLQDFLDEQGENSGDIYEVEETTDGVYSVSAPYQTKRIVIYSTDVSDSYGAENKYVYEEGGETILCFATEEDTKEAYEKIRSGYGEDNCYVDTVFSMGEQAYSWGASATGMSALKADYPNQTGLSTVKVAVLDTGIDTYSSIFDDTTILSDSYNLLSRNKNITDDDGHGTHVAGIIADLTPSNVQLLIVKVSNSGVSTSLTMSLAMDYAISKNVDVINLSFGFIGSEAVSYTFLDSAINRAYKKGIPVCAAAGNQTSGNGITESNLNVAYSYPANNDQTITVSALNSNMTIASYSYRSTKSQMKIDFAAPGTDIVSAGINGKNTNIMSGTSMAAPCISAAMAYIKMKDKSLSVQGACLELKKYCVDLGTSGKDEKYGYGCPQLAGLYSNTVTYSWMSVAGQLSAPKITSCYNGIKGTVVKWSAVSGASGYYLYRRKNSGSSVKIASLSASVRSYTDTKGSEGDYNVYYVVAYRTSSSVRTLSPKSDSCNYITMKRLTIKSLKAKGSKKVQLKVSRPATWYYKKLQVQYSSSKTFKKKTTRNFNAYYYNYSFKVNRKGTTYFRVRTKFTYSGKTYYSPWSTIKKIKVK